MSTSAAAVLKSPANPQEWESLIEEFNAGKWTFPRLVIPSSLIDNALLSLLKKDFPLKLPLLIFLEEFSQIFFTHETHLDRLLDSLRSIIQSPVDATFLLKDQFMISATSIFVTVDALHNFPVRLTESLVELLLTVINRPNHGLDRHTRSIACECLRQLEKSYPCLLSPVAAHLWTLCQSERTHASQSYLLLFTTLVYNIVNLKSSVSILNTGVPLVPFNAPPFILTDNVTNTKDVSVGLNYKELRRAMAFLLESPQVLTPCGTMEFLGMIFPLATALGLQSSMLKVQFFGMIYSFHPLLCHVVLFMYNHFSDAFDGQEEEIVMRLLLISRETQHYLVFRLLALHWLLGLLSKLILSGDVAKYQSIVELGFRFYPAVFDPLAVKGLKLDLLAFYSICLHSLKSDSGAVEEVSKRKPVVKLFEDGLVSVSAFKWLPPWSTETALAFRAFHRFLIGASSHSDNDSSTTRSLMDSTFFRNFQVMLVDLTLEFRQLVPVIVYFVDRLLGCEKHQWLGERLLQTIDESFLLKVKIDYKLVSHFPIFDRIAENNTVPPRGLINLLIKFMVFLVEKHGVDTGLKSWSHGSKVLGICRTMLTHHNSSRLFIGLSHLLSFACLYFPDLEVRDNARIYLRMLICIPGPKLRGLLNLGEQLLGISPSSHSNSFFNVQSPRHHQNLKKSKSVSSYIHIERMLPLLVKQCWSLSLSPLGAGSSKPNFLESIRESDLDSTMNLPIVSKPEKVNQPLQPLRVMDSKISEILGTLRKHFSFIPDFRHMPGLKVRISCSLRFESERFSHIWGSGFPTGQLDGIDALPAIYATVLKFSSSAPYGSIPDYHIPFLLGEPPREDNAGSTISLDIIAVGNASQEDDNFGVPVTIDIEPREPTPGVVDVFIEANAENGQIINGQLQSITVGIEDMFVKAIAPSDILEDVIPVYYSELFDALWEACGASCNIGRETFLLKGGNGVAAISGTQSVKLLEVPADSMIRATEQYLAPFVVRVTGEVLLNMVKDGGIIKNILWNDAPSDSPLHSTASVTEFDRGTLHLTYTDNDDTDERETQVNFSKRNMGCFLIMIFLPPRFHLLFQMEVSDLSTLVITGLA